MSLDPTDPALLFGGTWEQIEGRFLLASSSSYVAGSTGGSASVAVQQAIGYGLQVTDLYANRVLVGVNQYASGTIIPTMPPYLAVYMWLRIS